MRIGRLCAGTLICGLAVSGCQNPDELPTVSAPNTLSQAYGDPAAELVAKYRVGDNLRTIAAKMAWASQTAKMVSAQKLESALDKLELKYRPAWDRALATCYAEQLNNEDLESVLELGKESEAYPRLLRAQSDVSKCMHSTASSIPQEMAVEALTEAYN